MSVRVLGLVSLSKAAGSDSKLASDPSCRCASGDVSDQSKVLARVTYCALYRSETSRKSARVLPVSESVSASVPFESIPPASSASQAFEHVCSPFEICMLHDVQVVLSLPKKR